MKLVSLIRYTELLVHESLTEIFKRSLFLVLLRRLSVHEVIEAYTVLKQVVNATHDAENTEGEDPDTDNGDNGGLTCIEEPTEQSEECCNNVDNQDRTG
jgi:hypothetical protein